jgi:probable rRNA maturation factor
LDLTDAELSVSLVDDATIRDLNRKWRRLDRATDVLSFSQVEGEGPESGRQPVMLGDIVISTDALHRQARRFRHSVATELDRLMVHGVLHLLGHDHVQGGARATQMRREERRLLRLLRERRPPRKRPRVH